MMKLDPKVVFIGIVGPSGSGKTTLAEYLEKHLEDSLLISADSYYHNNDHLTPEERETINFDHPDAIDYGFLYEQLNLLADGTAIDKPVYDFKLHTRSGVQHITPHPIIIVEGLHLYHHLKLRERFHIKCYIDVDHTTCMKRRMDRDVSRSGKTKEAIELIYKQNVLPMSEQFVVPQKQWAHYCIDAKLPVKEGFKVIQEKLNTVTSSG